ncbi:hypothetical protein CU098_011326, partial [Rhizopus stolonifer]
KKMQENCHKRIHDIENNVYESPRKKFILEENFAKDMAAMSLYSNDSKKYTENQKTLSSKLPIVNQSKNVVRIDDMNQFLAENQDKEDFMPIVVDHKIWVDDGDSGLPLEICPGDERPRVPGFVLRNSELTDPRDIVALKGMMKHGRHVAHIEILNPSLDPVFPTEMDID